MPQSLRTLPIMLLTLLMALPGASQDRPELAPSTLRTQIRKIIPLMNRMVDVRVFEPIPLEIVSRDRFKAALSRHYTNALLRVQRFETDPEPVARPVFVPDRAAQIAARVADRLTSRFLIRFVHDGESKLLVVPENLPAFLDPDELLSRQVGPVVQFALVRELTRLADDERWRLAEKEPPLDNELVHLTARLALREGHAAWAAHQLARGYVAAQARSGPDSNRVRASDDTDVEQILFAVMGKGRDRGRLLVKETLETGKFPALRKLLATPPRSFADFPTLPQAAPPTQRPPDPLAKTLAAVDKLYNGEGWTTAIETPDRKTLATRLDLELPAFQVKRLLAGLEQIQEATVTNARQGQIHLTVARFANPSAAYSWCRAEEQRLASRMRTMVSSGDVIRDETRKTHDWPGCPVLFTVRFKVEAGDETLQIYQAHAVCRTFCLSIRSIQHPIPWPRLEAFLKTVLPYLSQIDQDPG